MYTNKSNTKIMDLEKSIMDLENKILNLFIAETEIQQNDSFKKAQHRLLISFCKTCSLFSQNTQHRFQKEDSLTSNTNFTCEC